MSEQVRATDTRFGVFRLHTECEHCGHRLPVNGPIRRLRCPDCGGENRIDLDVLTLLLNEFDSAGAPGEGADAGEPHTGQLDAGRPFRFSYTRADPRCAHCGGDLDLEGEGPRCVACGLKCPSWPVPIWLRVTVPSAVRVLGTPAPVEDPGGQPASVECPGCGGTLVVTPEHARITPCGYCGQEIFLPDEAWQRLRGPVPVRDWYIQFEGPSAEELRQREAREREERERRSSEERKRRQQTWAVGLPICLLVAAAALLALKALGV